MHGPWTYPSLPIGQPHGLINEANASTMPIAYMVPLFRMKLSRACVNPFTVSAFDASSHQTQLYLFDYGLHP